MKSRRKIVKSVKQGNKHSSTSAVEFVKDSGKTASSNSKVSLPDETNSREAQSESHVKTKKTASAFKKARRKRSRKEQHKEEPRIKKAKALDHDDNYEKERDDVSNQEVLATDQHYDDTITTSTIMRRDEKPGISVGSGSSAFPFPTVADDHCESPFEAYQDIVTLLKSFNQSDPLLYDPYYCDGSVVRHLAALGLSNVYNRKEDCYETWRRNATPAFDVLITNPPYSGNHIERIVEFAVRSERPWFLLLPQFVHKKDYYRKATEHIHPFYIVPKKRYVYNPPKDFREPKKSDVHKKSSPFVSMWFCWGGSRNESLIRSFQKSIQPTCQLARSRSALRDLRRKENKSADDI